MARKKSQRINEFGELDNCFDTDATLIGKWREEFGNKGDLILELGCGKAELSYGLAKLFPENNYVGIDLKMDRMWRPAITAIEERVSNIRFLRSHLLDIDEHFAENEVDELWITFPDPFPKNKQAKHRMINSPFLRKYREILKPGGQVQYKTDNLELFQYSLEIFVREGNIEFHALSFDLHEDERIPQVSKTQTTYEKIFLEMGKKINYVRFSFK